MSTNVTTERLHYANYIFVFSSRLTQCKISHRWITARLSAGPSRLAVITIRHFKTISVLVFTVLQLCSRGIAMNTLSVLPSVRQTRELWQNKITFCPHSYTGWKVNSSSFATRRMFGRGRPLLPEILSQINPPFRKRRLPIDNYWLTVM